MSRVLLVEDTPIMRESVSEALARAGHEVKAFPEGPSAIEEARRWAPELAITDLKMAPMSGLEVLAELQKLHPGLPVIVMTAYGTIETAVEAMKLGAFDFIQKPFKAQELETQAQSQWRLLVDNSYLPLAELTALGLTAMQEHAELPRLYTESAGLATFFMQGEQGRYREAWVRYQTEWKLMSPHAVRRGLAGLDGLISLYRDYRAVTDRIFAGLTLPKLSIETSQQAWGKYEAIIEDSLTHAGSSPFKACE